uniref:Ciliary microtubule associated protein 1B n=1 Tax=Xiphophorus couchianus TaxID=32473 RepID=A0A3B5MZ06_9TELE
MPSDELWVGPWKPHRPRGPIAALYGSPGPKYSLPGLIGQYSPERSGKMTIRSAPADKKISLTNTAGPATYTLPPMLGCKTAVAPSAPNYTLQGRGKTGSFHEDYNKTPSPGPAAYKVVDPSIYRQKPPQYSIKGRNFAPEENTSKPGPGAHYPEHVTFTRAKAPSFTFGLRHSQYIAPLIINVDE